MKPHPPLPGQCGDLCDLCDLCDRHASNGYDLRIVDLYQEPEEVFSRGVLAVPTLFKGLPLPVKMVIGDFTNVPQVLATSGLSTTKDA